MTSEHTTQHPSSDTPEEPTYTERMANTAHPNLDLCINASIEQMGELYAHLHEQERAASHLFAFLLRARGIITELEKTISQEEDEAHTTNPQREQHEGGNQTTNKPELKLIHREYGDELRINGEEKYYCPLNYHQCPEDATMSRGLLTPQLFIDGMKYAFTLTGTNMDNYVDFTERYEVDYQEATKEEVEEARDNWY